MLRAILRLLSVISIGLLLGIVAITIILNSSLITPTINFMVNQWIIPDSKIEQVNYRAPNHFRLTNLTVNNATKIKQLDAWFSLLPQQIQTPELDALLISGTQLDTTQKIEFPFASWRIHQLSANDISLVGDGWSAQQIDIQWQNPQWNGTQSLPDGQFQAYLPLVNWQDQQFKELLVRGQLTPQQQSLDAVSLKWNQALIQAQASRNKARQPWVIHELTAENLRISQTSLSEITRRKLSALVKQIDHIQRLDLIRGEIESETLKLHNLQLSATNFNPNHSLLWQQNNSQISLTAEGIEKNGLLWVEPNIKLTLNPQSIDIQDLNVSLAEGDVYLSANFQPQKAHIREFDIIGVRHTIESQLTGYPQLSRYLTELEQLQVDKLSIHNSQLIQLAQQPYWQLSGINLDLNQAQLRENHQWGLWKGQLYTSVNSLSYDKVLATQAIIEMKSDGKRWDLSRLFIPFNIGYVTAQGEWQFDAAGKPWKLNIETDSLPLKLFKQWDIPMRTRGLLDMKFTANGLSGDKTILRHTASGSLDAAIRQGSLALPLNDAVVYQPFQLDNLHIEANNGTLAAKRSILRGRDFYAIINGGVDLTGTDQQKKLTLTIKDQGQWKTLDILNPTFNVQ